MLERVIFVALEIEALSDKLAEVLVLLLKLVLLAETGFTCAD